MKRQAIYDTVRTHLLKQNEKAMQKGCVYLTPDGLKCAIGCLIPDGHPGQTMRIGVEGLMRAHPDLAELWEVDNQEDRSLLARLQSIHDGTSTTEWKHHLDNLALSYDLVT